MSTKKIKKMQRSFFRTILILENSMILNTIIIVLIISEFSHHVFVLPFEMQIKILTRIFLLEQVIVILSAILIKKLSIDPLIKNVKKHQSQADTDNLTGLYNRNRFEKMIDEYNSSDSLGVFFIDVNNLKYTNDKYGHEAGDELIKEVATVIKSLEIKDVYRFGGDEFVVILENQRMTRLEEVKQEIFDKVSNIKLSFDFKPTIALGMACGHFRDVSELISEADEKMYRNKKKIKAERKLKF